MQINHQEEMNTENIVTTVYFFLNWHLYPRWTKHTEALNIYSWGKDGKIGHSLCNGYRCFVTISEHAEKFCEPQFVPEERGQRGLYLVELHWIIKILLYKESSFHHR